MRKYSSQSTNYIHWFVFMIVFIGLLLPAIRIYEYGLNGALQNRNNRRYQNLQDIKSVMV